MLYQREIYIIIYCQLEPRVVLRSFRNVISKTISETIWIVKTAWTQYLQLNLDLFATLK